MLRFVFAWVLPFLVFTLECAPQHYQWDGPAGPDGNGPLRHVMQSQGARQIQSGGSDFTLLWLPEVSAVIC